MKIALEEAQANLTVAQSRAKSQADRSRRNEKFEVGDEVVLSTRNICVNRSICVLNYVSTGLDLTESPG